MTKVYRQMFIVMSTLYETGKMIDDIDIDVVTNINIKRIDIDDYNRHYEITIIGYNEGCS